MSPEILALFKDIGGFGAATLGAVIYVWAISTDRLWTKGRVDELKRDHKEDLDKANALLQDANSELRVYQRYQTEGRAWPQQSRVTHPVRVPQRKRVTP